MTRTTRSRNRRGGTRNANNGKGANTANRPGDASALPATHVDTLHGPTNAIIDRETLSLPVSHEQIALAAYDLWQQRGGSDVENWLDAETELRKQVRMGD